MVKLNQHYALSQLATLIDAPLSLAHAGLYGGIVVQNVATINEATPGDITFLINSKYCNLLQNCQAAAVIVQPEYISYCNMPCLVTANPKLALAKLMRLCMQIEQPSYNIHPSAVIGQNCSISPLASIGPN